MLEKIKTCAILGMAAQILCASSANAIQFHAAQSGSWISAGTWVEAGSPGAADQANVSGGFSVTLSTSQIVTGGTEAMVLGDWGGAGGTLNIVGPSAALRVQASNFFMGHNAASTALNIHDGGQLSVDYSLRIGRFGGGLVTLTDGAIYAGSVLVATEGSGTQSGHLQIDGGDVSVGGLAMGPGGSIDLAGDGRLIFLGRNITDIAEVEDGGRITAYAGTGTFAYEYGGGNTTITALPGPPVLVEINIDTAQVINSNVVGLGYNIHPVWMPPPGPDREAYFDLFGEAKQSYIRTFLYFEPNWEGSNNAAYNNANNDDDDAWTSPQDFLGTNSTGWAWSGGGQLHEPFVALLDYCESHDIWVEVNNSNIPEADFMKKDYYLDPASYPIPYSEILADAEELGENLAALVYYLKTEANSGQGYDCVKYWSLINEGGEGIYRVDYPGILNLATQQVHDHLAYYDAEMGTHVLDEVQSMGVEGFPFYRDCPLAGHPTETWPDMVGKGYLQYLEPPDGLLGEITIWPNGDPYMDAISIHDYWGAFDFDRNNPSSQWGTLQQWLLDTQTGNTLQQIKDYDMDGQIEPVFIGELGGVVYSGSDERAPAKYPASLYIAEAAIRALQVPGVSGVSRWCWNAHEAFAAVSYPGCWWETEPLGVVHPLNENYYPYILLTANVARNSQVLSTQVTGSADASKESETWVIPLTQRVWATTFKAPDGTLSLIVVNDSYTSKATQINFSGEAIGFLNKSYVSAQDYEGITTAELTSINGKFQDTLLPRSIVVYTETAPDPATLIRESFLSGDIVELVINTPDLASRYHPEATTNLMMGSWESIAHSTNGLAPFIVTNLGYSSSDATGTNEVIYLQGSHAVEFFKIIGE